MRVMAGHKDFGYFVGRVNGGYCHLYGCGFNSFGNVDENRVVMVFGQS